MFQFYWHEICLCPLQLPQVEVHSMLCFLHDHLSVVQSVWQLHLISRNRCSGAGGGTYPLHTPAIPGLCLGWSSAAYAFHFWTWKYIWRLWFLVVVGKDCRYFLKQPFHKTIYVRGSLECQLTFHCRVVLKAGATVKGAANMTTTMKKD